MLTVDDFDIGYEEEEDLQHLEDHMNRLYTFIVDRSGGKYVGINTEYDRSSGTMRLSMPYYYEQALQTLTMGYTMT